MIIIFEFETNYTPVTCEQLQCEGFDLQCFRKRPLFDFFEARLQAVLPSDEAEKRLALFVGTIRTQ